MSRDHVPTEFPGYVLSYLFLEFQRFGFMFVSVSGHWFCFNFVFSLSPFQDYISSYETGPISRWGEHVRIPRKKNTWYIRKLNLVCLTCAPCGNRTHTRQTVLLLSFHDY